jgi:tetratricopeptide (TPR) repeat protein
MLVRAELPGGGASVGSGTLLRGRLVLTAAHVVFGDDGEPLAAIRVGPPGIPALPTGRVCWPDRYVPGGSRDAALLEITDSTWVPPRWLGPVRWGRLTGRAGSVACEAIGFPRVLRDPDGARVEDQISARINPGTARSTGARYDLHVTSSAPLARPGDRYPSPWSGASGAGVFAGGLLVGVIVIDTPGFGHERLTAVPTEHLLADPAFRACITGAGADVDIVSVELGALVGPLIPRRPSRLSPASLLRAEAETVPFRGRRAELADLTDWCTTTEEIGVRLLTGAAGQGKTRLARQLTRRFSEAGWVAGFLGRDPPGQLLDLSPLADTATPVLLVVDYAETRSDQLSRLVSTAWGAADIPPIRMLLLARSAGEWWDQLRRDHPDALGSVTVSALPALDRDPPTRRKAFAVAVTAFAHGLTGVEPDAGWRQLAGHVSPPQDLNGAQYGSPLRLQMSALVSLLQSGPDPVRAQAAGSAAEPVERQVLDREQRYWEQVAADHGLSLHPATLSYAVTTANLLGASNETDALTTLSRVPGLRGADEDRRLAVARWLRDLYPPSDGRYWGTLQPDLLAEHQVVSQLAASPDLADACLHDLDTARAVEALTVLARACTHHPEARGLITAAARRDLAGLGVPVALAAVQTGPFLGQILAEVAVGAEAPLEVLIQIQEAIPSETVVLARASVIVTRRIVEELPDSTDPAQRAGWTDSLAERLTKAGEPDQALPAAQQAAAIYRELASANPDQYRPDLAQVLDHLGIVFRELGRPADALPATEEALAICRELASTDPNRHLPNLARSLENLGIRYSELGRHADALPATEEAVAIFRDLARTEPSLYRPDLARSLHNLATDYSKLGRPADALPPTKEAVAFFRELASTNPDSYHPFLAGSLDNLAGRHSDLRHPADAVLAAEEAVAIYRELANTDPDLYRPGLAGALDRLGFGYSNLGRPADALPATEEAVAFFRELASINPGRHRPNLAQSLDSLGVRYSELGRPNDALAATGEAVAIFRELASTDPDLYRPGLAGALDRLGFRYSNLGRPADALPATEEAVAFFRELASTDPGRHRPNLAQSLNNLGIRYSNLGRPADALPAAEEAVAIFRELASTDPDPYRPGLAGALDSLGVRYSELGRPADALAATQEAVAIYRELASTDPGRYRSGLADALDWLGIRYSYMGRPADALPATEEAVAIYRELASTDPGRHRPDVARSLTNLSVRHSELGRPADAFASAQEAQAINRELASNDPDTQRFAHALQNLGIGHSKRGRKPETELASAEAEAIHEAHAIEAYKGSAESPQTPRARAVQQITFSPDVSLELAQRLRADLDKFHEYLARLGLAPDGSEPLEISVGAEVPGSFYYPDLHRIEINTQLVDNPHIVFREYCNYALTLDEWTVEPNTAYDLLSGLDFYLPCSFSGDAAGFAQYGISLEGTKPMVKRRGTPGPGNQPRSYIWASIFWEARQLLSPSIVDHLVAAGWLATVRAAADLNRPGLPRPATYRVTETQFVGHLLDPLPVNLRPPEVQSLRDLLSRRRVLT